MWATDHSRARWLCVAAAFVAGAAAGAMTHEQPAPVVSEEDMARAVRETPTVTDEDVRRAQQRHAVPVPPLSPLSSGSIPRIDALPQPLTRDVPDLSAIARGYAANPDGTQAPGAMAAGPALFVFASLAMPEATLARLVDQAARARASILIRGLAGNSLRETVVRVQKLIGTRQVSVQIDPQAFDRYAIHRVPAFVLARDGTRPPACASGACPPPGDFVSASGDVSLDYALGHLRRAAPGFTAEAEVFLARLKP